MRLLISLLLFACIQFARPDEERAHDLPVEDDASGVCQPCPPGSYADKDETNNCTLLDKGDACSQNNGSCPFAPPDYNGRGYIWNGNITLCTACDRYQYTSTFGNANCSYCPIGSEAYQNGTGCNQCPPGETTTPQLRFCNRCVTGKYTNATVKYICSYCSAGYQPDTPPASCKFCPDGTYSNPSVTGGLCSKCTPYVAAINRTMCLPCNPGYYAPGGNVCVLCPKGRAWDPTNMCPFQCRPGTYCHSATWQNQTYCDYCDNCPAGSYSDDWAQTECIPCEKGRAQPRPGELSCVLCQPGSYQNMTNQENCLQCPADYYCPSYGTIDPVRCPSDQSCPAGSAQPISCRSMFTATSEGCKPTVELVAIITGSCIAAVALVGILLFRRYKEYVRKQGEEQQLLLAAKARQEPVYNGF